MTKEEEQDLKRGGGPGQEEPPKAGPMAVPEKEKGAVVPPFLMKMAANLGENAEDLKRIVLQTAMYKDASQSEFRAFMLIASGLELNPMAGEIYAFRKRGGGLQAIVGKDGFYTLANRHPAYDGREIFYLYKIGDKVERLDYQMDGELVAIECRVYRKDRSHPEIGFAKMSEYCREGMEPWKLYPTTMLTHKAFILAAKASFGLVGVTDADDAAGYCDRIAPVAEGELAAAKEAKPEPMRLEVGKGLLDQPVPEQKPEPVPVGKKK